MCGICGSHCSSYEEWDMLCSLVEGSRFLQMLVNVYHIITLQIHIQKAVLFIILFACSTIFTQT